jgi:hypothetical protein
MSQRSQITAKFFETCLFRFAEFAALNPALSSSVGSRFSLLEQVKEEGGHEGSGNDEGEAGDSDEEDDHEGEEGARKKGGADEAESRDPTPMEDLLFVSNVLEKCVMQQVTERPEGETGDTKAGVLKTMWDYISAKASTKAGLRKSLGLSGKELTCDSEKAAQLIVDLGYVNLPQPIVARALRTAASSNSNVMGGLEPQQMPLGDDGEVSVRDSDFLALAEFWRAYGGEKGVRIHENEVLWAALWALAAERAQEMYLMGQLFVLYDTSGDGWLQFEEFTEFLLALYPECSKSEAEELFLCGAEEVTGDMTKDVFLNLAMRLGLTSDVDHLQSLVTHKYSAMYGDLAHQGDAQGQDLVHSMSEHIGALGVQSAPVGRSSM